MATTLSTPVRPTPTLDRAAAMRRAEDAYRRFADLVGTVGPTEWDRPTDCELWTVRDLVGHVVGAMRSAASLREFVGQQREIGARVKREGGDETDMMTQVQVERTSGLTAAELVAECDRLVAPAAAGRRRMPSIARRLVTFPVVMGPIEERWTLGYLVDVILTRDTWLHRVDLSRALGRDIKVTEEHDGAIVADVVGEWAARHGRPYELELTGPAGGHWANRSGGEKHELDAVEFCRILSGRAGGTGLLTTAVPF